MVKYKIMFAWGVFICWALFILASLFMIFYNDASAIIKVAAGVIVASITLWAVREVTK